MDPENRRQSGFGKGAAFLLATLAAMDATSDGRNKRTLTRGTGVNHRQKNRRVKAARQAQKRARRVRRLHDA